jgi:hypothetical protein
MRRRRNTRDVSRDQEVNMMRAPFIPLSFALLCGIVLVALPAVLSAAPQFNPANFPTSTSITNKYFPLTPGTLFLYEGSSEGQPSTNHVYVTYETKVIVGIPCVVVRDTVWVAGQLTEATIDWYAQDREGNVWYMGEWSTEYPGGSHAGSWQAGVLGAQPGIIMEDDPEVGDVYRQEYFAGHAEDMAAVLSVTASVCVPYDCYSGNVLLTRDWTPLEPGAIEHKYYAIGVGNVKSIDVHGGSDVEELVAIQKN